MRELLNSDVEGIDDFGDWVFDRDAEDFERHTQDWMEISRESVKELLIAA